MTMIRRIALSACVSVVVTSLWPVFSYGQGLPCWEASQGEICHSCCRDKRMDFMDNCENSWVWREYNEHNLLREHADQFAHCIYALNPLTCVALWAGEGAMIDFEHDLTSMDLWHDCVDDSWSTFYYCGWQCNLQDADGGTSPILLDLDRGGFHLTSAAGGVYFDIDGDGNKEWIAWTDAGSGDAWLAFDRNFNGKIDSGAELFGDSTFQPPSDDPNGFAALAEMDKDEFGGNGDGVISAEDGTFAHFWVWTDRNHNGLSEPEELQLLYEVGITEIDLQYHETRRRDTHGNEFRYHGVARSERGAVPIYDVFLSVQ